ncbi:MAG: hypothetical protein HY303_10490 [Candidatus Wallbacteria bacterium]|nr:hypothetical protein [Candidatus Wallbacteria bacterium]
MRYRHAFAFRQAFVTLGAALRGLGFRGELAQAVVDTALAADDPDSALEIARNLPGLAGRVLSAHVTLATTDEAPAAEVEAILKEPLSTAEPHAAAVYEHLEQLARRHFSEAVRGQALLLLLLARHREKLDCRDALGRLLAGPPAWRRRLDSFLVEADPLEPLDGDYWTALTKYAESAAERPAHSRSATATTTSSPESAASAALSALAAQIERRSAAARPGPYAALMACRALGGDRPMAVVWARRAAAATPQGAVDLVLPLSKLMARAGLLEDACALLGPLERALVSSLSPRSPSRGQDVYTRASRVFAQLASLALLEGRDERAFDYVKRSIDSGGDPRPALRCLEQLGALPATRPRAVALMETTTSCGALALSTAARVLERAGDLDGALARYRRSVAFPAPGPLSFARLAWLESTRGSPTAALETISAGLRQLPADPVLIGEVVRHAALAGRSDRVLDTLIRLHPDPPRDPERLRGLLGLLEAHASDSAGRSSLTTLFGSWLLRGPADCSVDVLQIRVALARCELALGRSERTAELVRTPEAGTVLQPSQLDAASRALLFLARARSLAESHRVTAAVHAGLLALDAEPNSVEVSSRLVDLINTYPHPGYLMGAFYLKTTGNPLYAPFQARYHAAVKDDSTSRSYYRAAVRAFPDDSALRLEYARFLLDRGDDRSAAQVYLALGERRGYRYDRSWGPPLARITLARGDTKTFLDVFSRWLVQEEALDSGIARSFLRLGKQAGLLEQTADLLSRLCATEPRFVTLHEALALALRELGRDGEAQAAERTRETVARSPDAVLAGVYLGDLGAPPAPPEHAADRASLPAPATPAHAE